MMRLVVARVRLRKRWAFWRKHHTQLVVISQHSYWTASPWMELFGRPVFLYQHDWIGGGRMR